MAERTNRELALSGLRSAGSQELARDQELARAQVWATLDVADAIRDLAQQLGPARGDQ
jgi:hypothetical protein